MTLDLAEVLQKEGVEAADDVIIKFLQRQSSESRHWPDDDTLNNAFLGLPLYHLLTRGRLRLVLEGIEEEFRGPKTEDGAVPKNLTIEHVLPQGWRQHWPLANAVDGIDPRAIERDRLLHSIGNLTLVNSQLNPSLSNGPWEKKREGLNDHSVLFLNKDLLRESYTDHWDESTIRSRSEQLASLAARVWPGPDSWP